MDRVYENYTSVQSHEDSVSQFSPTDRGRLFQEILYGCRFPNDTGAREYIYILDMCHLTSDSSIITNNQWPMASEAS